MSEIIAGVQCTITRKCKNNRCIYRLRDVYGHPVFGHLPELQEGIIKACEKAGLTPEDVVLYPRLEAAPGTNVLYMMCEDYIAPR